MSMGHYVRLSTRARMGTVASVLALIICLTATRVEAGTTPRQAISSVLPHNCSKAASSSTFGRHLGLVEPPPVEVTYHGGALLTSPMIPVFILYVGEFSTAQRSVIQDFFASVSTPVAAPSVNSWWKLLAGYKDSKGVPAAPSFAVAGEMSFGAPSAPMKESDIEGIVARSLQKNPAKSDAIYVVLTDSKVQVESFCMDSCASHYASNPATTKGTTLPYIWVGNPETQCPGLCAWPYAKPQYGPPDFTPLTPPNHDVGIDGMVINLAFMLPGTVTNPFSNGFYQGDQTAPLEAATACTGMYGINSYPGYPGELLKAGDGASYNVNGVNDRKFLCPAVVNVPKTQCVTP